MSHLRGIAQIMFITNETILVKQQSPETSYKQSYSPVGFLTLLTVVYINIHERAYCMTVYTEIESSFGLVNIVKHKMYVVHENRVEGLIIHFPY